MILFTVAMPLWLAGCTWSDDTVKGDGNVVVRSFSVDHFNAIDLGGMFEVTLEPGSDLMITVETDENLQDLVNIEVRGEVLHINTGRNKVLRPTEMKLHIIYPDLQKISVGGACKITSQQILQAQSMEFEISGAASIDMEVEVEELTTKVSGAGDIDLEGSARSHRLILSGASRLDAENLVTQDTDVRLSGAGAAHVHATNILKANLSGIGSIRYYGTPRETIIDKSGLGSIRSGQ